MNLYDSRAEIDKNVFQNTFLDAKFHREFFARVRSNNTGLQSFYGFQLTVHLAQYAVATKSDTDSIVAQ